MHRRQTLFVDFWTETRWTDMKFQCRRFLLMVRDKRLILRLISAWKTQFSVLSGAICTLPLLLATALDVDYDLSVRALLQLSLIRSGRFSKNKQHCCERFILKCILWYFIIFSHIFQFVSPISETVSPLEYRWCCCQAHPETWLLYRCWWYPLPTICN
jgi:hypothetical protein